MIKKILNFKSIESLYFVVIIFFLLSMIKLVMDEKSTTISLKEVKSTLQITNQK